MNGLACAVFFYKILEFYKKILEEEKYLQKPTTLLCKTVGIKIYN
jgi:hypothetical protein